MARAKKSVKKEIDNNEFFEALRLMEEEKGIPQKFIAEKIAEIKELSTKQVEELSENNAKTLFNIDKNH